MATTLAFLDESGDESGKLGRGASRLFVVGLVVFGDAEEAARCKERIDRLRGELGKPTRFEFHFRRNAHDVRLAFLRAVAPFAFTYFAVAIEKPQTSAPRFDLYADACARVCALAGEALNRTRLTVDMRETDKFARDQMAATLRRHVNRTLGRPAIERVRPRKSGSENLVQLADYATGVRRWVEEERRGASEYRHLLRAREGRFIREAL